MMTGGTVDKVGRAHSRDFQAHDQSLAWDMIDSAGVTLPHTVAQVSELKAQH